MVVEDDGIFAPVMRSVIRGINVLTRSSKMVAFATVDEAIRSTTRLVANPEGIADLAGEMRSAIKTQRLALDRLAALAPLQPNL